MPFYPRNYSRGDVAVAEAVVALLAAFAKTGHPAPAAPLPPDAPLGPGPPAAPAGPTAADERREHAIAWPRYDLNTQQYLSIGSKLRVKSHYRGHKMALWLHLIPQL
ncbi:PREDICTED: neuroligin-3-like, partial [Papilio polytes]|uniref:neuroligin-3-like n=1 Tax=Papilio polytes TaxID=76194 RepID=UPI0006764FB7